MPGSLFLLIMFWPWLPVMNFFHFPGPSDELDKEKSLFKKINCVLKVENLPKEIDYTMTMGVFVAFGRVD